MQNSRDFLPPANLEEKILASSSPVSSAKNAQSWLEKKGWALNSETCSINKLADILFLVALLFKLLAEANTAICSLAFLICDQADKDFAGSIADKIINKVIDKLNVPVENLNNSIAAAKSFINATSQQHTSKLISLQGSVKQHNNLVKALAESSLTFLVIWGA